MTRIRLKHYVKRLNEFLEKNPHLAEKDVIYSSDDEGNDYHFVFYSPTAGYFDGETFEEGDEANVVCIN